MEITPEQKRKILSAVDIIENGDLAVLTRLVEFQETIDGNSEKISEVTSLAKETLSEIREEFDSAMASLDEKILTIENGKDGTNYVLTDEDKRTIAKSIKVPVVEKIIKSIETIKEQPIVTEIVKVTNEIKEIALKDSPDETVDKVNASNKIIQKDRIEGLADIERIAKNNQAVPVTTTFINGKRAKNISFNGATVTVLGDTAFVSTTGGGHTIQDEGVSLTQRTNLNFVGAGVTATDDSANDATKVTISTSAGAGYQQPTAGSVNGTNQVFSFAVAPNALVVDGVSIQKTAVDTTVNWTGTTNITLAVAPNFDIYGVA